MQGRILIRFCKPADDRQADAGFDQEIVDGVSELGLRTISRQADFKQAHGFCREFDVVRSGTRRSAQREGEGRTVADPDPDIVTCTQVPRSPGTTGVGVSYSPKEAMARTPTIPLISLL